MVAHERVDAGTEQGRDAGNVGHWRMAGGAVDEQASHGDADHDAERQPAEEDGAHLDVFGFLDVEECEGAEEEDEGDEGQAVAIDAR